MTRRLGLAVLFAAALICGGCSAIGEMEGAALDRAKSPIIITIYHTKF